MKTVAPARPTGIGRATLIVIVGITALTVGLIVATRQEPKINGVPVLSPTDWTYVRLVGDVAPERVIDNAATITFSINGEMVGPFPWLGTDVNNDGKPDVWVRDVLVAPNAFIMLSVSQLTYGRIACGIYDLVGGLGGQPRLIPDVGGNTPFNSRPDPGAVRCYRNRV